MSCGGRVRRLSGLSFWRGAHMSCRASRRSRVGTPIAAARISLLLGGWHNLAWEIRRALGQCLTISSALCLALEQLLR